MAVRATLEGGKRVMLDPVAYGTAGEVADKLAFDTGAFLLSRCREWVRASAIVLLEDVEDPRPDDGGEGWGTEVWR